MSAKARSLPWLSSVWVSFTVLLLISFIGLIIVHYFQHYLADKRCESHYYRSLQLILAAVSVVVISRYLLLTLT